MPRRWSLIVAVAGIIFSGCVVTWEKEADLIGDSTVTALGIAELVTVYAPGQTAVAHVVFVPAADTPEDRGYGSANSIGGTASRYDIQYGLVVEGRDRPDLRIDARPVVIHHRKTVEADGQTFDLTRGNIFLVHVNLDGTLLPIQLPHTNSGSSVMSIVSAVKAAVPHDPRVQALTPS
jgi:hypothetical protein